MLFYNRLGLDRFRIKAFFQFKFTTVIYNNDKCIKTRSSLELPQNFVPIYMLGSVWKLDTI